MDPAFPASRRQTATRTTLRSAMGAPSWAALLAVAALCWGACSPALAQTTLFFRGELGTSAEPRTEIIDLRCLRDENDQPSLGAGPGQMWLNLLSQRASHGAGRDADLLFFTVDRQYLSPSGDLSILAFIPAEFHQSGSLKTRAVSVTRSSYTVEPGALLDTLTLDLGGGDYFTQNGGVVTVRNELKIGFQDLEDPRPIVYTLNGGTLKAAGITGKGPSPAL